VLPNVKASAVTGRCFADAAFAAEAVVVGAGVLAPHVLQCCSCACSSHDLEHHNTDLLLSFLQSPCAAANGAISHQAMLPTTYTSQHKVRTC
jgi:hypothetical protein